MPKGSRAACCSWASAAWSGCRAGWPRLKPTACPVDCEPRASWCALGKAERDRYPTAAFGEPLNRDQLIGELPGIAPVWTAGLLFNQDGQIDNRRQLMCTGERLRGSRCAVRRRCGGAGCFATASSSAPSAPATRKERSPPIPARRPPAAAPGALLLPELQIAPVKGQMLSLQAPRGPSGG